MSSAKQTVYQIKQALGTITLRADQRTIFEEHYLSIIEVSHYKCRKIACLFHTNRLIITIGSIIVPALLSIQYNQTTTQFSTSIYWCAWILSLSVTISNGFLTLFKFDKKYFLFHATYEQLRSEGWQYLALTGSYNTKDQQTHEQQFNKFMHTVEKILMRQAQEQYIKLQEVNQHNNTSMTNSAGVPSLVDVNKSPSQDDAIVKLAKYLQSQSTIGGSPDQNVIQNSDYTEITQTRGITLPNVPTPPV
jgi:hypothetical protein